MCVEDESFLMTHAKQLLEVALRSRISKRDNSAATTDETNVELLDASNELLEVLEARVGSSNFIGAYSDVQRMIESGKAEKKRRLAADAVVNPTSFAQRKVGSLVFMSVGGFDFIALFQYVGRQGREEKGVQEAQVSQVCCSEGH